MSDFERRVAQLLETCHATGELVAFHRWSDDPSIFVVGRVTAIDPDACWVRHVDSGGLWEEAPPERIAFSTLARVHRDSDYLRGLRRLADGGRDQIGEIPAGGGTTRDRRRFAGVLKRALEQDQLVTLRERDDSAAIVTVREVGRGWAAVTPIVEDFDRDGEFIMRFADILAIRFGTEHEVTATWLWRQRLP